jgi:hypothetical protein
MHFGIFPHLTRTPDALAAQSKDSPELSVWPLEIGSPRVGSSKSP